MEVEVVAKIRRTLLRCQAVSSTVVGGSKKVRAIVSALKALQVSIEVEIDTWLLMRVKATSFMSIIDL